MRIYQKEKRGDVPSKVWYEFKRLRANVCRIDSSRSNEMYRSRGQVSMVYTDPIRYELEFNIAELNTCWCHPFCCSWNDVVDSFESDTVNVKYYNIYFNIILKYYWRDTWFTWQSKCTDWRCPKKHWRNLRIKCWSNILIIDGWLVIDEPPSNDDGLIFTAIKLYEKYFWRSKWPVVQSWVSR